MTSLRHTIAQHRIGSHRLGIEEVRWFNIDKSKRICRLCEGAYIEDEEHVSFTCTRYEEIRLAHNIDKKILFFIQVLI